MQELLMWLKLEFVIERVLAYILTYLKHVRDLICIAMFSDNMF